MAKSDGSVRINTLVDTEGFDKGMNTMQKKIGGLSGSIGKLGASIAATFAVKKLIQFGKQAIDLGSDLQEVQNVVDVTFTTMSDKVNEFAKGAAEAAGLSETMAKRYVGTFGAMAKAFGFAENESYTMATALTQLAGDVASFYNLTQDEAYTKLKSVFTGETESLKDLGVVMTQSALDSFAMAKGWGKTTAAMEENEKVALRFAFVTEQLNAASGDFIRTQDSWANQTRILSLNFDTFKANIGQALINIFTPFLKVVNQIVDKMAELSHHFVAFSELLVGKSTSGGGGSPGEVLGEIASGYENITDATNEATKAQRKYLSGLDEIRTFTDDSVENIGMGYVGEIFSTNNENGPSKETIDLVDKLKGKIDELKKKLEPLITFFENRILPVIRKISDDTKKLVNSFTKWFIEDMIPVLQRWVEKLDELWNKHIKKLWDSVLNFIAGIVEDFGYLWDEVLQPAFDWIANDLLPFITPAIEEVGNIFMDIFGSVIDIISYVIDAFSGLITFLSGTFTGDWNKVWEGLKEIFIGFINICITLVEGFVNIFVNSLNNIISSFNDFAGLFGGKGIALIPEFNIPDISSSAIVKGKVAPPNASVYASKHSSRNLTKGNEEDSLRKIVREEVGKGNSGSQYKFTAQINRRTLFEEMIEEAKLRETTTGRNPFDLR